MYDRNKHCLGYCPMCKTQTAQEFWRIIRFNWTPVELCVIVGHVNGLETE